MPAVARDVHFARRADPQVGAEELLGFRPLAGVLASGPSTGPRRRRRRGAAAPRTRVDARTERGTSRRQPTRRRRRDIGGRCYRRHQQLADLPENFQTAPLSEVDPEIAAVLERELRRQQRTLEMIASENFVPQAVLDAVGSVLTNKYAEGYPGRRYYGGCEEVDVAEQLAIDRAKALFGAEHVNVQAARRRPGQQRRLHGAARTGRHDPRPRPRPRRPPQPRDEDQRLGQALQPGRLPRAPRGLLGSTWTRSRSLADEHKPKLIVAGWSAYPRQLDFAAFREIADSVGAMLMVDMAHFAGLVAAGEHPNPVPHADVVTTTIHKTLCGPAQRHDPLQRGARARRSTKRSSPASRAGR